MAEVRIRKMTPDDVVEILAVDQKLVGKERSPSWPQRVTRYLEMYYPPLCHVAEVNGHVVGFILGDIRGWEFAIPKSGWIEIVGVDPAYHGKGVARALIEKLHVYFRNHNVERVMTMVNWNDGGLVSFFRALGFERSEFIILEKGVELPK